MHLETNTLETNSARREQLHGHEHLVVDVVAAKAMELNGGYVPAEEWEASAAEWNRVPLPLGHPMNSRGQYISARAPKVIENAVVGDLYNAHYNDENQSLEGELWVDVDRANQIGETGERVVEMLESGEPLEVSTAYRAELGEPGVYNGEYRETVRVNLRPDHLALLPGDLGPGKCSVEDGCGTGTSGVPDATAPTDAPTAAAANSAVHPPTPGNYQYTGMVVAGRAGDAADRVFLNTRNALQEARTPAYDSSSSSRSWSGRPAISDYIDAYYEQADADADDVPSSVSDLSQTARNWIAKKSLLGDPDADSSDQLLFFPVVTPDGTLVESALDSVLSTVGSADISADRAESVRRRARSLLEDEFDREFSSENQNAAGAPRASSQTTMDDSDTEQTLGNATEGDRVRWDSDGDTRYGIVVDELPDESDEVVLVAAYEPSPGGDDDNWQPTGDEETIRTDTFETLGQFPSASDVANDATDEDDTEDEETADADTDLEETSDLDDVTDEADDVESGPETDADAETVDDANADLIDAFASIFRRAFNRAGASEAATEAVADGGAAVEADGEAVNAGAPCACEDEAEAEAAASDDPCSCNNSPESAANADDEESLSDLADESDDSETADADSDDADGADDVDDDVAGDDGDSDPDPDTTNSVDMTDYDLETIADKTGFDVNELEEFSEERLDKLSALANADEERDDRSGESITPEGGDELEDEDEDEEAEAASVDDDSEDDEPANERGDSTEDDVDVNERIDQLVEERVNSILEEQLGSVDDVAEVAANHRQERQQRRENLKNTVLSNSSVYTEEMLSNMDDQTLEATARASRPSTGTDFGARPQQPAQPSANDDESGGPKTTGTMANWMAENGDD